MNAMINTKPTDNQELFIRMFTEACKRSGLKVTHQRTEIFKALLDSKDHPSAEMLHKRILHILPTISLDTVYRTLATLEQHGLISRINTAGSQARFEAVSIQHHHLICSRCNTVIDFHWPDFDRIEHPESINNWGNISSKNVVIYGICNNCINKS